MNQEFLITLQALTLIKEVKQRDISDEKVCSIKGDEIEQQVVGEQDNVAVIDDNVVANGKEDDESNDDVEGHLNLTPGSTVPCLPYSGDILTMKNEEEEVPLWAGDCWTEERVKEAEECIKKQGKAVTDYWRKNYEEGGAKYWHNFYKRNTDNFYKDRHYLHLVFPELDAKDETNMNKNTSCHLLEVGCGVGNAVLPLLEVNPKLHVQAIDCARSAVEILRQHPLVLSSGRLRANVVDILKENIPPCVHNDGYDFALCMFVLSALPPHSHATVLKKLSTNLKVGGKLFVRDYGRYDQAQLRFSKGSKLNDNFYVRQDGTCAYFFTTEELSSLASGAGLVTEECYYIQRQYANRKEERARYRVWLHAKFKKI